MRLIENEWRWFDEELNIPYPWYTSPCLKHLITLGLQGKTVFEYGVGDSTEWWRKKGTIIDGVDNNIEWALKTGAQYKHHTYEYINAIDTGKLYDIIVVDGEWRDECVYGVVDSELKYPSIFKYLKPYGLVIIDNYKQPSVQEHWPLTEAVIERLRLQVTYFKEPDHYDWQTIILKKP